MIHNNIIYLQLITFTASAAEAELAAGFQQAQLAVRLRHTLQDLGYPQQPTLLPIDNTVAIGLANDTMNKKISKSMGMRFFWLRDRVQHINLSLNIFRDNTT